jgi:hypothetical protein
MEFARGAALDAFLDKLRDENFVIGVDRMIRVEQILRTHGDQWTPRELRTRLRPLLSSSQQQQERFDKLFQDWFLAEPPRPREEPKPDRWWLFPLTILLLIFLVAGAWEAWHWYYQPIPPLERPQPIQGWSSPQALITAQPPSSVIPAGAPIVFDSSTSKTYGGAPFSSAWNLSQKPGGSKAQLSSSKGATTILVPDLPGPYTVQLTIFDGIGPSNPYGYGVYAGQIQLPESLSTFTVVPGTDRWTRSAKLTQADLTPLRWLLIPLGIGLVYLWRRYHGRRAILDRFRQADRRHSLQTHSLTLPPDPRSEATAAAALRSLRRPALGRPRLSLAKSILATIRNGDFPTLQFDESRRRPEYLVLIDTLSVRDHQSTLFQSMIRSLGKRGLQVYAYLYAGDPRVCRPMPGFTRGGGSSKALVDLVTRHANARLLVFGDGGQMFYEQSADVQRWAKPVFEQWPERFLFTPKTVDRWSDREAALQKELRFRVLPAVEDSLRTFESHGGSYGFHEPAWDYANAETLKADLYPQVYQWLSACALYPRLEWILTMRLGAALGLYSEENRLQLIRLPWFRLGEMPLELQQELVEGMSAEERRGSALFFRR